MRLTQVALRCYFRNNLRKSAMPVSTTLKLPEDLKKRLGPLAKSAGKTPHAWMIDALETQVTVAEKRRAFINDARAAGKKKRTP